MDVDRAAKCPGKYPPLATDTEVNSCSSKNLNSEIIMHKKMKLIHLFMQPFHFARYVELNKKGNSEFE